MVELKASSLLILGQKGFELADSGDSGSELFACDHLIENIAGTEHIAVDFILAVDCVVLLEKIDFWG